MVVELILSYSVAKTAIVSVMMKRRIKERGERGGEEEEEIDGHIFRNSH
jgi:hypothetical protein